MCPIVVIGQLEAFFFFGANRLKPPLSGANLQGQTHFPTAVALTSSKIWHTSHFTVATGDALKRVISGWYLSTLRERTPGKNLMLIAIANLGLQQSAAVGLSKQKDWETDWRNKIWTAEYRVQICGNKFPQQSDFISFAISYTSWISTCKLIKLSASKNLSPINFSSYWIYKQWIWQIWTHSQTGLLQA